MYSILGTPSTTSWLISFSPSVYLSIYQLVKNLPANIGDTRDVGLIPGLGRSSGGGRATCSSILAWRIPWTEEPGRLQSLGSQRVGHN